ncbi:MAG: DNA-formamidopyrimidine glycosylase family protein [bacterium]
MPELPDIVIYLEALEQRILNRTLERVQIASPFLLRTATPPITSTENKKVIELRRLGKRICIGLEDDLWLVLHLMIAGRLHWKEGALGTARTSAPVPPKSSKFGLAAFHFTNGTLSLTEAGTQRRASLRLVQGEAALEPFNPGGLEIFEINAERFAAALKSENHTLKRSLTDPRLFSGIGNAYSDEILWQAQLSPIAMTQKLNAEEIDVLFNSTRATLNKWIELLRNDLQSPKSNVQRPTSKDRVRTPTSRGSDRVVAAEPVPSHALRGATTAASTAIAFPEKVTAFRPEMAVHGKYGRPCPRCENRIQRIRYAANETNYCPTCQTAGKLLADRALSRLLRADWPRTAEELEDVKRNQ